MKLLSCPTLALSLILFNTCAYAWVTRKITNTPLQNAFRLSPHEVYPQRSRRTAFLLSNEDDCINVHELPKVSIYNSKTRKKEILKPLARGKISMYTCGPTVYDYAHVGNFRAFLTYDLLKRVLLYLGYEVVHVCNLTDVDDKIIKRANEQNLDDVQELTRKYEDLFFQDLRSLNIVPATLYPRATEHIPEMMNMILKLQENGLAYETSDGSWYFRTSAKEGYGKQLINMNQDDQMTSDDDFGDEKENVQDFCLWKAFKPDVDRNDVAWSSEDIAKGRPGWHLECSAMAKKYLGDTIDLHGGGVDLKFPHHENEIAQSEGATGKLFCQCWFHNGFVNIDNEKMSKSLGNFLTLRKACPSEIDVRAYRYLVISSQYRNPLSFTQQAIDAAKNALKRMDKCKHQIEEIIADSEKSEENFDSAADASEIATSTVPKALSNFDVAITDDLSMPRAAASLFALIKAAEKELKRTDSNNIDIPGLKAILEALERMDKVFGIFYEVSKGEGQEDSKEDTSVIPDEVIDLVNQRKAAKESKDWELADSLRGQIGELGYAVKDVKDGEPIVSQV